MKSISLHQHPEWRLYQKIRAAVAEDLALSRERIGGRAPITEESIDAWLRVCLRSSMKRINKLFREDLAQREALVLEGVREVSTKAPRRQTELTT